MISNILKLHCLSVRPSSFQVLLGQTNIIAMSHDVLGSLFFFFFLMGFVFCDSYYPTDRRGPTKGGPLVQRGGPTRAKRDMNEKGLGKMGGTSERKLDECIMHQVHTNLCKGYSV
jgi:hypothetical protein